MDESTSTLWVYSGTYPSGHWLKLDPRTDVVQGLGSLQFELAPGIVIEGPPAYVLDLLLRSHLLVTAKEAVGYVDLIYNIFREAGWRGPAETNVNAVPGRITVASNCRSYACDLPDVRSLFSQLQSPEFNGFLSIEEKPGTTVFVSVRDAHTIKIEENTLDVGDLGSSRPDSAQTITEGEGQ